MGKSEQPSIDTYFKGQIESKRIKELFEQNRFGTIVTIYRFYSNRNLALEKSNKADDTVHKMKTIVRKLVTYAEKYGYGFNKQGDLYILDKQISLEDSSRDNQM